MHANIVTLRCFTDPSARRSHEKIHTGEKPFKCKHCDELFNRQTDCKRHEKTHTRTNTEMYERTLMREYTHLQVHAYHNRRFRQP